LTFVVYIHVAPLILFTSGASIVLSSGL